MQVQERKVRKRLNSNRVSIEVVTIVLRKMEEAVRDEEDLMGDQNRDQ